MPPPFSLSLYVIIDPEHTRGRDVADVALAAARGGATLLQYRDKISDTRSIIKNITSIQHATADSHVPLLINDRVDIAMATGAAGVHLGQTDMPPADARRLLGPDAIIGLTVKNAKHASEAADLPIDYACIGGVFATTSKINAEPPLGLDGLKKLVDIIKVAAPALPVGAIAGITAQNVASVRATGVEGVAVLSAVTMAQDVERAARNIMDEIQAFAGMT